MENLKLLEFLKNNNFLISYYFIKTIIVHELEFKAKFYKNIESVTNMNINIKKNSIKWYLWVLKEWVIDFEVFYNFDKDQLYKDFKLFMIENAIEFKKFWALI